MRITIICKTSEWQVEQLKKVGVKLGVDIDVRDITEPDRVPESLGDVVLWRSSSLGGGIARFNMMNALLEKRPLINRCLAHIPQATEKAFQQNYVQKKTKTIKCISTFTFHSTIEIEAAISAGTLRYPFIQKPDKGSKGQGVEFVHDKADLERVAKDIGKQVYQNFITNSGDYRVFILGGRMLGAIKRTAEEGGFLNNISRGGSAQQVTDPKILANLRRISTTIASLFELTICGVDIIHDDKTGEYLFLEVNTVPQWKGFQAATNIDVAGEIVSYCNRMVGRGKKPVKELVSEEYQSQIHMLGDKKFHFLSRLYLWSGNGKFIKNLDELRAKYIGSTEDGYRERLKEIFLHVPEHGGRMVAKEARQTYFKKYPTLEPSLGLLFKNLFVREIYGVDLHKYIRELVSDKDLLNLKMAIESDADALRILSTHAINFLYMLDDYLGTDKSKTDPEKYLQIGTSYPDGQSELQIYFFTHCIIGASRFYSTEIKPAESAVYLKMLRAIEDIIENNFQTISLDNKFEFLVCAKICGHKSALEEKILSEADQSLAPDGNFLIDIHNAKASPDERNDFISSEHRNVLYIMSQTPFHPTC
jgi:RimK family alpha-L-glutamate ligase